MDSRDSFRKFYLVFVIILFAVVLQLTGCIKKDEVITQINPSTPKHDAVTLGLIQNSFDFGSSTPQQDVKKRNFNLGQYVKEESHILENRFDVLDQRGKVVEVDVEEGYNLYIYSGIVGAVEEINIYGPNGKLYESPEYIACDNPVIIKDAEKGKWSIEYIPIIGDLHQAEIETIFAVKLMNPVVEETIFVNSLDDERITSFFGESRGESNIEFRVRERVADSSESKVLVDRKVLKEGKNYYYISVKNELCYSEEVFIAIVYDSEAPIITVRGLSEGSNVLETHDENSGIGGIVSELAEVRVNGKSVMLDTYDKDIYFGYNTKLSEGDNYFTITAVDDAGNEAVKEVVVKYTKE